MTPLSVNAFRAYPPRTRMIDLIRSEAAQGRYLSNDPRRAGYSVRRRMGNPPPKPQEF